MSIPPSPLLDQLSPMPMVCPLVKLGRSSPPTADQGYRTALDTHVCSRTQNESNEDYSVRSIEQNYHTSDNLYTKHQTHKCEYNDIYSKLQNKSFIDKKSKQAQSQNPPDINHLHQSSISFMPELQSRNRAEQGVFNNSRIYHGQHSIDNLYPKSAKQPLEQLQYCTVCEQSSNHSSSSLDCEQTCPQKLNYYTNSSIDSYQNTTNLKLSSLAINDTYWNQIQNKSYEECQSKAMCRHNGVSQEYFEYNIDQQEKRSTLPTSYSCNYLVDNFKKLRNSSPNLDQGYHTLVSPSPGPSICPWTNGNGNANLFMEKKMHSKNNSFDKVPDDIVLKILSWLHSYDLSVCARVCRRFEILAWRPILWNTITLYGEHLSGDKAIRGVLRQLCGQGRTGACPGIEKVCLSDGVKLSDRGVILIARRCPELTYLQAHCCTDITNSALSELVTRCTNLQHLDITGCINVSCITVLPGPEPSRRLFLQYLDLTDCSGIDDNGLRTIVLQYPQIVYLYLRRCIQITDAGLKHVPSFCSGLRELSVSDCSKVTDFGLYELAKLGATLRYLSVAKCDQVSDAGLKVIARRCYKLRYLNARGCEAVSDDAITVLARSCTRLRALDIGKCDVSDAGLRALAESCPNIKKLSLRNCDLVTDRGVQCIAYYCRGLQQLNIQDCQISLEGYRAVKIYCKRCIIEHTNPGFF